MSDLPYFAFYPQVWLSDPKVRLLTFEERGIYHELLALMWTYSSERCALPNDDRALATMLGTTARVWKAAKRRLISGNESPLSITDDGDWVVSPRLIREWEKAKEKSRKATSSADSRWSGRDASAMRTHSERNANAQANAERSQSGRNATQDTEVEGRGERYRVPPTTPNGVLESPGPLSAGTASPPPGSGGAPRSNGEIVAGLIEHFERAVGRKPSGEERGIIAHALTTYGVLAVSAALGELAAMCDKGQPPKEPGPYLAGILRGNPARSAGGKGGMTTGDLFEYADQLEARERGVAQ